MEERYEYGEVSVTGFQTSGKGPVIAGIRNAAGGYDPEWIEGFHQFVDAGLAAINITLSAATLASNTGSMSGGIRARAALNTTGNVAKTGVNVVEQVAAVHGNSLKSLRPTWSYKLYSQDGTFLKNSITSKLVPESRYSRALCWIRKWCQLNNSLIG